MNVFKIALAALVGAGLTYAGRAVAPGRPIVVGSLLYLLGIGVGAKSGYFGGLLGSLEILPRQRRLKLPPRQAMFY